MSSPAAFNAIHDYLVAQWGATTPLVFENEPYPLAGTATPWVMVEIFGDAFVQASIGADPVITNRWCELGQVLMHVMTPNGTGTAAVRTFAKQLVDLFRGQEISGIRFRDASIGASQPGARDGNYFRMTATINWELYQ